MYKNECLFVTYRLPIYQSDPCSMGVKLKSQVPGWFWTWDFLRTVVLAIFNLCISDPGEALKGPLSSVTGTFVSQASATFVRSRTVWFCCIFCGRFLMNSLDFHEGVIVVKHIRHWAWVSPFLKPNQTQLLSFFADSDVFIFDSTSGQMGCPQLPVASNSFVGTLSYWLVLQIVE